MDWTPILLTIQLSAITTIILLVIGLPIAYNISKINSILKPFIESIINLPIVLPSTVLGFYLLLAFSPSNTFGQWIEDTLGIQVLFSFTGLVIASVIYSAPFMIQSLQTGFQQIPQQLIQASKILGKSDLETFFRVILPNMKHNILNGIVLTFAHTLGEFGIVLMIGGSIPGKTKVASIAIYEEVEMLNYTNAHLYSIVLLAIAFCILFCLYIIHQKSDNKL
ncbi:molybdate ABC transporter permease subunit [Flammeovirga sp. SubArs3]|uniref:molybdate ABC transporter permease subunit n=1 Tax=Flammeovirga sp. SubArs3 TaxID=2995316 RepID=UPI00248CAFBD|nr:molybdate ABC transporter permease subunit [Flammeovirga sp. SubArs3]